MTDCFFTINVTVFIENCTNSLQGLVNFAADIITEWLTACAVVVQVHSSSSGRARIFFSSGFRVA